MSIKVIGFFTQEDSERWFWDYGERVKIFAIKLLIPQGDGSPHEIIKMDIPDDLVGMIYPAGMEMDHPFEEYEACLETHL